MYTYIHSLNVILLETFINCILHPLPTQQDSSWYSRLRSDVAFHIHCYKSWWIIPPKRVVRFPTLGWNIFHPLTTVYNFHLSQTVEILWVVSTHRVENSTLYIWWFSLQTFGGNIFTLRWVVAWKYFHPEVEIFPPWGKNIPLLCRMSTPVLNPP